MATFDQWLNTFTQKLVDERYIDPEFGCVAYYELDMGEPFSLPNTQYTAGVLEGMYKQELQRRRDIQLAPKQQYQQPILPSKPDTQEDIDRRAETKRRNDAASAKLALLSQENKRKEAILAQERLEACYAPAYEKYRKWCTDCIIPAFPIAEFISKVHWSWPHISRATHVAMYTEMYGSHITGSRTKAALRQPMPVSAPVQEMTVETQETQTVVQVADDIIPAPLLTPVQEMAVETQETVVQVADDIIPAHITPSAQSIEGPIHKPYVASLPSGFLDGLWDELELELEM